MYIRLAQSTEHRAHSTCMTRVCVSFHVQRRARPKATSVLTPIPMHPRIFYPVCRSTAQVPVPVPVPVLVPVPVSVSVPVPVPVSVRHSQVRNVSGVMAILMP